MSTSKEQAQNLLKKARESYDQGFVDIAKECWLSITEDMDKNSYSNAMNNIAFFFGFAKGNYDLAFEYWNKITENMNSVNYAYAQYGLGLMKQNQRDKDKAREYWLNIKSHMSIEFYCEAQYALGLLAYDPFDILQAKMHWDQMIYANSSQSKLQFKRFIGWLWNMREIIGYPYIVEHVEKTNYILNIRSFEHELMYRISLASGKAQEKSSKLFNEVQKIIKILHLGNEDFSKYDNSFAHYTRHTTALRVMDKEKSAFRLSSMHFMNDPKEGKLINDLLDIDVGKQYEDSKHLAFASCFSFNHNSLNQFRLYGKTDGQENSGVSLVFNKDFFQMDMNENSNIEASIARIRGEDRSISNMFSLEKSLDLSSMNKNHNEPEKNELISGKQPLYRCIYMDPESGYLRVARRSKISFYRSDKTKGNALEEYNQYVKSLDKADGDINDCIANLKIFVEKLKDSLKDESVEQQENIWALVNDILLPLRYLIKHAAFEEEEECRMIYITDMCDPKIKSDPEKKWLYVEYAEPVKDHIKKVYLGDGAKDYRPFFERTLGDKSKVKDSNNLFRT